MTDSPQTLYRSEQLGPARASVTVERMRWLPSGELRYVLTETFEIPDPEPGQPDRVKQISVTDVHDNGERAVARAHDLADRWSRSSQRRDELAPDGNLPELAPAKRTLAAGIPGLNQGATLGELLSLLRLGAARRARAD